LKGVLDILFMVQDLPADTPNQFAVASDQGRKGSFVSVGHETPEELSIIQLATAGRTHQVTDVLENSTKLRLGHLWFIRWDNSLSYNISAMPSPTRSAFFSSRCSGAAVEPPNLS
jgi:hypothetical protein